MTSEYAENGYFVVRNFYTKENLQSVREVLLDFHAAWLKQNAAFYAEKAVNSAYITGTEHLPDAKRKLLFGFIGSSKLMALVNSVMRRSPAFMNTQLFFNPFKQEQKNYWHRDPQYHLSLEQQQQALQGPEVIHFRIPLVDEPGLEVIPGTHKRWDSHEELEVRWESNGRKNHENISTGVSIALNAGDVMVFSANLIHRGLYGMDRLSFDILFCDPEPDLMQFVRDDCLPDQDIINTLESPEAFIKTKEIKCLNKLRTI